MKTCIQSTRLPAPVGPYSQAVCHNGLLYLSGQISIDAKTGAILKTDVGEQTRRILENIKMLLEDAGSGLDKVLKCSVFLSSTDAFDSFNAVYGEYFGDQAPARTTVVAQKIFGDLDVEMDAIAYVEETQ
jgi:2-iminobutanoate/2-iminopropanoate deaminase